MSPDAAEKAALLGVPMMAFHYRPIQALRE